MATTAPPMIIITPSSSSSWLVGVDLYFACTFLVTMALGLVQQRRTLLEEEAVGSSSILPPHRARTTASGGFNGGEDEESSCCCCLLVLFLYLPPKSYGAVAVLLIGIQALVSVVALGGTAAFPPAAAFVALTLLCHHTLIHWHSRFEGEACSCAPFQCKDVSNHETWVVVSLVAAAVSWMGV